MFLLPQLDNDLLHTVKSLLIMLFSMLLLFGLLISGRGAQFLRDRKSKTDALELEGTKHAATQTLSVGWILYICVFKVVIKT